MTFVKNIMKRLRPQYQMFSGASEILKGVNIVQAMQYDRIKDEIGRNAPENIATEGFKVYSQTDEDGIIEAIFRRIAPGDKSFVEIGIQTGIECNSLYLLLKGWRGTWIEGDAAACAKIGQEIGGTSFPGRFRVTNSFVTRENIVSLLTEAMAFLNTAELDFFSLDIDGNDLHVMQAIFDGPLRPKAICVEYNGKFPPPVSLTIDYDPSHVWDVTDYMGSTIQAFHDQFTRHGYRLVTCNIPGINAFFVREDLAGPFPRIPVEQLYQPYRAYLSPIAPGHRPSLGYLRRLLSRPAA